ncbi:MAG: hypothetical protein CVV02_00990 [Firmicutes bacterium HGW-Firmicutes-7]|nr:MAG: hypothetical protein CVV02_00990 [Firmicutes bacterium HGW-Firmicutes-7]
MDSQKYFKETSTPDEYGGSNSKVYTEPSYKNKTISLSGETQAFTGYIYDMNHPRVPLCVSFSGQIVIEDPVDWDINNDYLDVER